MDPVTEGAERQAGSGAMFDGIAPRYDLLNRIMSLGNDRAWRRRAIQALALQPGDRVLDLATGTADLAIAVARLHPDTTVTGVDPSPNMMKLGQEKVAREGLAGRITLQMGDAQRLPFPDQSFNAICMGFGIRNVPDRPLALREMRRVTRPGGRIAILELSEPQKGLTAPLARFIIRSFVPWIGGLLSGSREYRYLQESIAAFPRPEAFSEMMRQAGLEVLEVVRLTMGACHVFVGTPRA